ncbi:MAG: response regulator transcription factor [Bacteroidota bacterium]
MNVALADDHEIVRNGIKMLLESDADISVIWEASDGQETIDKINQDPPDVLVVDIRMPIKNGLEVVLELKNQSEIKVILLTMHNESEYIMKSLEYGADGYLLKDTSRPEFIKAIKMVSQGQKYYSGDISNTIINSFRPADSASVQAKESKEYQLTKREKQILRLIYDGVGNKEIADQLGKSIRTIETHRFNIMKKLGVNNITELLRKVDSENLKDLL